MVKLNSLSLLLLVFCFPILSQSSDSDPLQDFCVGDLKGSPSLNGFPCKPVSEVTSEDFFFGGFAKEGNTSNVNGVAATTGNVLSFPGLNTLGISMNRVDFAVGGVNPPHSHPRSTETVLVMEGELLVGFVSTGNVFYSKVLKAGEMFVIPRGMIHFQRNVGKVKALAITAFNSQLPGAAVIPTGLFGAKPPIPNNVLTKAFRVKDSVIDHVKSKFVT